MVEVYKIVFRWTIPVMDGMESSSSTLQTETIQKFIYTNFNNLILFTQNLFKILCETTLQAFNRSWVKHQIIATI